MPSLFQALPGMEVPVGAIAKDLAKMWEDTAAKGGPAPESDDVRAMQVNFVLHLGFSTTPEDALAQFRIAVRFSRRYPCRVVVLCPLQPTDEQREMQAKIYGECHLGKTKGDKRCCEFVILSYPQAARAYLENQVSVCLSNDLPLYYWAHRFSSSARLSEYQYLLSKAKRVMFDSGIVPLDALTFPWPRPEGVRDLVFARLLPVRQSIGQFLSAYAPAALGEGLREVRVTTSPDLAAEGRVLLRWVRSRIERCGVLADAGFVHEATANAQGFCEMAFSYGGPKLFVWRGDLSRGAAQIEADFGKGRTTLAATASLLSPEAALGEAMFFDA